MPVGLTRSRPGTSPPARPRKHLHRHLHHFVHVGQSAVGLGHLQREAVHRLHELLVPGRGDRHGQRGHVAFTASQLEHGAICVLELGTCGDPLWETVKRSDYNDCLYDVEARSCVEWEDGASLPASCQTM